MNAKQHNYRDDPTLLKRVFVLLDSAFPGLPNHARSLEYLGLHWDKISTPFLFIENDEVLSHVGILEVPMVIDGREIIVGGIHAVATHPGYRRRGLYRKVMTEAMAWCDERYDIQMLIAGVPKLYEQFGFKVIQESVFRGSVRQNRGTTGSPRQLDLGQADDTPLLLDLLNRRVPVSQKLGVVREQAVFLFTRAARPLGYFEELNAIICYDIKGTTLFLYDVVAEGIPTLQSIINHVGSTIEEVIVYFVPDRLKADLIPERHLLRGDSYLMAKGLPFEGTGPLILPVSARF